ncbi:uncharacterized protein [Gossypium hirsutum]|uniref:Uncharacterized protein isoform X1 n=1 Tax=Gossypium hirsutum TaxID=3635 RepID=A0ABM3BL16_GOSHI|nr:uncharacterized protein LOC107934887 isoform X1 [Gossypium hirsutum]XP_040967749.1 uncharacterized protein LOC107934887 isoform X1 [Gossypium hirsutum]
MKMISFFVTDARKNSKTHYTVIFSAVSVFGIFDSLASSAPVHQLQQYYREGVLDNCYGKWSALWDCLYLKTKPSSQLQEILEAREKAESHIWTFRTLEEAQAYWKQEFGHLNGRESK